MCAIFGVGFLKGHTVNNSALVHKMVRALFMQNMIRGRTASGIACVSYDKIDVIKKNVSAKVFIDLPEYNELELSSIVLNNDCIDNNQDQLKRPTMSIIGHCRLKTKGTELDNNNNHPIICNNVVGVHNGCINNDDELFNTYLGSIHRNGEVDSEIIFSLIDYFSNEMIIHESIQQMSTLTYGSFACAMVHREQPHIVWLFRRHNPCDIILFEDIGLVVWSSEMSFIKTVLNGLIGDFDNSKVIQFPINSGMGIDLARNRIHHFKLDIPFTTNNAIMY